MNIHGRNPIAKWWDGLSGSNKIVLALLMFFAAAFTIWYVYSYFAAGPPGFNHPTLPWLIQ